MLLECLFFRKPAKSEPPLLPAYGAGQRVSANVSRLCLECYIHFLNDFVSHVFDEMAGENAVQGHFYASALAIARLLGAEGNRINCELEASHLAEQQRQKARRNYRELRQLAESVLVDQRNYLLAHHVNTTAVAMGFHGDGTPFSGVETENGQPCHAFACKLLADSSLGRGAANGLSEDAITLLEQHLARRAELEISRFLHLYRQENVL